MNCIVMERTSGFDRGAANGIEMPALRNAARLILIALTEAEVRQVDVR